MTDRIDHVEKALTRATWVLDTIEEDGVTLEALAAIATLSQVSATLALVEQQRIANLIALMDSPRTATSVARVAERTLMEGEPVVDRELRPDIAAALGIEVDRDE